MTPTELRALAAAATKLPWYWEHRDQAAANGTKRTDWLRSAVATQPFLGDSSMPKVVLDRESWYTHVAPADAAYIVAAANAVPDLLDRLDKLEDIIARVAPTAEALQYRNPNAREDAYNKGVRDLRDAIARAALEGADHAE